MHEKVAWVVTDWMNGACGMERKETTEAVRCSGECRKWKRNEMQGFGVRNERSSWNVMGLKECTDRKHMDKSIRNVFSFLHNYRAVGKYWGLKSTTFTKLFGTGMGFNTNPWSTKMFCGYCPHWKACYGFHCYPKFLSMKTISGFRGLILWLAKPEWRTDKV